MAAEEKSGYWKPGRKCTAPGAPAVVEIETGGAGVHEALASAFERDDELLPAAATTGGSTSGAADGGCVGWSGPPCICVSDCVCTRVSRANTERGCALACA